MSIFTLLVSMDEFGSPDAPLTGAAIRMAGADPDFPKSQLSTQSQTYTISFNDKWYRDHARIRVYLYQGSNGPTLSVGTVYKL